MGPPLQKRLFPSWTVLGHHPEPPTRGAGGALPLASHPSRGLRLLGRLRVPPVGCPCPAWGFWVAQLSLNPLGRFSPPLKEAAGPPRAGDVCTEAATGEGMFPSPGGLFPWEESVRSEAHPRTQTFHPCCFPAAPLAGAGVPSWLISQFHFSLCFREVGRACPALRSHSFVLWDLPGGRNPAAPGCTAPRACCAPGGVGDTHRDPKTYTLGGAGHWQLPQVWGWNPIPWFWLGLGLEPNSLVLAGSRAGQEDPSLEDTVARRRAEQKILLVPFSCHAGSSRLPK